MEIAKPGEYLLAVVVVLVEVMVIVVVAVLIMMLVVRVLAVVGMMVVVAAVVVMVIEHMWAIAGNNVVRGISNAMDNLILWMMRSNYLKSAMPTLLVLAVPPTHPMRLHILGLHSDQLRFACGPAFHLAAQQRSLAIAAFPIH